MEETTGVVRPIERIEKAVEQRSNRAATVRSRYDLLFRRRSERPAKSLMAIEPGSPDTVAEVERLMKAAQHGRYGHRDASAAFGCPYPLVPAPFEPCRD